MPRGPRQAITTAALLLAAVASLLALAATAEAGKKPGGTVVIYGFSAPNAADTISFGQLFSKKRACVSDRPYKAIVSFQGKRTVVDSGRTSDEGGISVFLTVSDFPHDRGDGFVSLPRTKKCAKVTGPVSPDVRGGTALHRAASSLVNIIDVFGIDSDGVMGGFIESSKAKCLRDRKVKLTVGSKTVDVGTTTSTEGTFALHIRIGEFGDEQIAVTAPDSKGCAASVGTFSPL